MIVSALSSALLQGNPPSCCRDAVKGHVGLGSRRCQQPEWDGDSSTYTSPAGLKTSLHSSNCVQPPIYFLFIFCFVFHFPNYASIQGMAQLGFTSLLRKELNEMFCTACGELFGGLL